MDSSFHGSIYSRQFNILQLWGAWPLDGASPKREKLFLLYSYSMLGIMFIFFSMGVLDFIEFRNDFRKVSWNLCVNLIIIVTILKNIISFRKSKSINALRRNLFRSEKSCATSKQVEIYQNNLKNFKRSMMAFYYPYYVCFPIWAVDSLYWFAKINETPLPFKWFFEVESEAYIKKAIIYVTHMVFGGVVLIHAMTTDLAMFGIMFQIFREYEFLLTDIEDLNKFRVDREDQTEVAAEDERLKNEEIKSRLGIIINRQREIIRFTEDFESNYNGAMMVQIFVGGFLIIMNCIQTLTLSLEFHVKMTPQGGYVLVIIMDGLILCLLGNKISDKCKEVGDALYNTAWYTMDVRIQKDIVLVLMRSQKPPRITSGRLMDLNVANFSELMKNLYGWMAIFRRVGFS